MCFIILGSMVLRQKKYCHCKHTAKQTSWCWIHFKSSRNNTFPAFSPQWCIQPLTCKSQKWHRNQWGWHGTPPRMISQATRSPSTPCYLEWNAKSSTSVPSRRPSISVTFLQRPSMRSASMPSKVWLPVKPPQKWGRPSQSKCQQVIHCVVHFIFPWSSSLVIVYHGSHIKPWSDPSFFVFWQSALWEWMCRLMWSYWLTARTVLDYKTSPKSVPSWRFWSLLLTLDPTRFRLAWSNTVAIHTLSLPSTLTITLMLLSKLCARSPTVEAPLTLAGPWIMSKKRSSSLPVEPDRMSPVSWSWSQMESHQTPFRTRQSAWGVLMRRSLPLAWRMQWGQSLRQLLINHQTLMCLRWRTLMLSRGSQRSWLSPFVWGLNRSCATSKRKVSQMIQYLNPITMIGSAAT